MEIGDNKMNSRVNSFDYARNSFGGNTWKLGIIKRIPVEIALNMPEIASAEYVEIWCNKMKSCSNCLNYACNSLGGNTWKLGVTNTEYLFPVIAGKI